MKSQGKKDYYIIKIKKDHVDWIFHKDSKFRSIFTLFAEFVAIITFILLYLS